MAHAIIRDGAAIELQSGVGFLDTTGVQHPASVVRLWGPGELASIGVYPIVETDIPGGYRSTGATLVWDGATVTRRHAIEALPPIGLETIRRSLKADIDAAAEAERGRYITPGSGQAMTYQAKADEARRYIERGGLGEYPLLNAEVGVTGETLQQVAQIVANLHAQWQIAGGLIERVRLSAKASIDAAPDEASARAVMVVWPDVGGAS